MKSLLPILLVTLLAAPGSVAAQSSQPRINEIVLEATQGDNDGLTYGPSFKITLRRDGAAFFTGKAKVKLMGDFRGTIGDDEFEKLADFLNVRKYLLISSDPINAWRATTPPGLTAYSGSPWMTTTVTDELGQTKTITRPTNVQGADGKRMPKNLLEIEQAVFDTATRIKWKRSP